MPADPYRLLLLHPNMACGDCENVTAQVRMTDECFHCPAAEEALALDGYPRGVYLVDLDYSAESCPMFVRSRASRTGEPNPGWMEHENATERGVRAARGFAK